ncbi:MAG: 2-hydroxyacyl-CoA dehydratase [Acidobacteria bacterium]|nr:2-hydroxyacyl-CoA dehydratase [Acidobacteriota bacterium]
MEEALKRAGAKTIFTLYEIHQWLKMKREPSAYNALIHRLISHTRRSYKGKVLLTGYPFPMELAHSFGLLPMIGEIVSAMIASAHLEGYALRLAEREGYLRDGCSFHRATLGAALSHFLPVPAVVVAPSMICDGVGKFSEALAKRMRLPYYFLDVPHSLSSEAVHYVAGELREITTLFEEVTKTRLSKEKLRRAILISNETRRLMLKVAELRKRKPSPMYGRWAFNFAFISFLLMGTEELLELYRRLLSELEGKLAKGDPTEERYRILFLLAPPYHTMEPFHILENRGAHTVFEELSYVYWDELDPDKPFISLARKVLKNQFLGSAERRADVVSELASEYDVDGAIHFSHFGCRQGGGGVRILKEALASLGVPLLDLDGDCVDPSGYSSGQVRTRIEGFLEML